MSRAISATATTAPSASRTGESVRLTWICLPSRVSRTVSKPWIDSPQATRLTMSRIDSTSSGRDEQLDRVPDRLVADVAVEPRRAAVPGLDPAVRPEPDHAVVGGLDDRRHRAQRLLGAPARGDLGGQLRRALLHAALEVLVQQRAFERRAGLVAEGLERAQLLVGEQLLVRADELQDAEDVLAGAQLHAEVGLGRSAVRSTVVPATRPSAISTHAPRTPGSSIARASDSTITSRSLVARLRPSVRR